MDLELRDAVAVVGGSSAGLGRAAALAFAQEGARVVVNGRREDLLRQTADEIRAETGAEVEAVPGDLSRAEDCTQLIARAVERFGRIDALVTNAGGPPSRPFEDLTDEEWISAYQLTLLSTVRLIREALPYLRESKGAVVNISSIAAKQPIAGLTLSNSLRAAVVGVGKTLADDLAASGIRVNNAGAGQIWTDRQKYLTQMRAQSQNISEDEAKRRVEASIPLGRFGRPEELASLIVFLASPRASYITGQTVLADGGAYKGLL